MKLIRFASERITFARLESTIVDQEYRVMAPGHRAQWKGFLKVGEVSCGVALYTAASTAERITFNTVNKWAAGISDTLALGILC